MVANASKLPPREVHNRLLQALTDLEKAQKNAVLWFDQVVRRRLYRDFGYASIYQYAELELGFKKSKTAQFLRLCESMKELPELRRVVASGGLSWTKAREVAKVATPETEGSWIRAAQRVPNRELERRVTEEKRQARVGISGREQVTLEMGAGEKSGSPGLEKTDRVAAAEPSVPVDLHVRMTAEQYARYQALMETLAKGRVKGDKAELLLAGLEQLALATQEGAAKDRVRPEEFTRVNRASGEGRDAKRSSRANSSSPYQVIVQKCPSCKRATLPTSRGEETVSPRDLRAILCDAYVRGSGRKNKASIPPRLRRAALERDRYRCRSAGCGRTSFLAVHHLAPKEAGGPHLMENLITLCSGCHRALHDGP